MGLLENGNFLVAWSGLGQNFDVVIHVTGQCSDSSNPTTSPSYPPHFESVECDLDLLADGLDPSKPVDFGSSADANMGLVVCFSRDKDVVLADMAMK